MNEAVSFGTGALWVLGLVAALQGFIVIGSQTAARGTDAVEAAPRVKAAVRTRLKERAFINV